MTSKIIYLGPDEKIKKKITKILSMDSSFVRFKHNNAVYRIPCCRIIEIKENVKEVIKNGKKRP